MTERLPVTVRKRDHTGALVWSYDGVLIERAETAVCLEAFFNRADHDAGYHVFKRGDRFIEWFYSDRWYNIFAMYRAGGPFVGWYCNVTRPARFTEADGRLFVDADDLALDLFIAPDGVSTLLDADEFAALDLSADEQAAAWAAVDQLRARRWVIP